MTNTLREHWGLPALQQALQAVEPGLQLEVVESIDSTNTALLQRAAAARAASAAGEAESLGGVPHGGPHGAPCLLVAERQTQGRGRQGRSWHGRPGSSLTFSLGLMLAPPDWSGLSLTVGVALADALDSAREAAPGPASALRIGLKWPNDLWLRDEQAPSGGRKLGGVLIETGACAGGLAPSDASAGAPAAPRICVIGVGLNVGPQIVEEASSGVAWVQELQPGLQPRQVLACVAAPLLRAVRRFERQGFSEAAAFARRDLLQGRAVSTTLTDLPVGTAQGVDDTGALRVTSPDGALRAVAGGEVSIRLQPRGPACA